MRIEYSILKCLALSLLLGSSCKKSAFLDAVPDHALVLPQSLGDYQAILDNDLYMNGSNRSPGGLVPDFEEAGTDDYFANDNINTVDLAFSNLYTWQDDIYGYNFQDWAFPYRCIYYANTVLDGLAKLKSVEAKDAIDNARGSALFYRAHMFYHLVQVFAPPYDSVTAATDAGIPLRLSGDINEKISRASIENTYRQVIKDINEALSLLPSLASYKTRPSKAAAYGLLSKIYLSARNYTNAALYADSALQLQSTLMDYNTLNPSASAPFARYNNEVIFQAVQISNAITGNGIGCADSTLYQSYAAEDLRKKLFFAAYPDSGYFFKGSYDGSNYFFGGIAVDEMYLIRAEGYARSGNTSKAMADLNALLNSRWLKGFFTPLTANSSQEALTLILSERRKELAFRGTRWMDIRRLNKEKPNITIQRTLNGAPYSLTPNNLHYTYLVPPAVLAQNPEMPQNPR